MSLGDARIPEERAKKAAERKLRLNIGTLPHLGNPEMEDNEYIFPVLISLPRVVFDETPEGPKPSEVKFMSDSEVGKILVDARTGDISEYTSASEVESAIREEKKELELAVQRALIKSASKELALLSYARHRQMPLIEILSEIILTNEVEARRVKKLTKNYDTHVQNLIDVGLIKEENGLYMADDRLNQIISDNGDPSDRLSEALAFMFKKKAHDLDMMNDFLRPYLEIAGYYYTRAVTSESLPKITLSEFRKEISSRYSGKEAEDRSFKTARWLIQLEQIGLLEISQRHGDRAWQGDGAIKDNILSQRDELDQFAVIA